MSPYRRVNFQLPCDLAKQFESRAVAGGITKAKLLRSWLNGTLPSELPTILLKSPTTFNFRLSEAEYMELENEARTQYKVKLSQLLRAVIAFNIEGNLARLHISEKGRLPVINSPGQYRQVLENARGLVQAGKLRQADELLDSIEFGLVAKEREALIFGEVDLLRAMIARYARDLDGCERMLDRALQIAQHNKNQDLISRVCDQIGVLADIREQIGFAIKSTQKMVEINPLLADSTRYKLRILNLFALSEDPKIRTVLKTIHTDEFTDAQKIRLVMAQIRIGNYSEAAKVIDQIDDSISVKERKYLLENRGVIHFRNQEYRSAYSDFLGAERLEAKFRSTPSFSKAKLYRQIIEGMWGSQTAWSEAKWMVENQHRPTYQSLGKYLVYSSQWLSGDKGAERQLNKLKEASSTPLIRKLTRKSLHSKEIFPLV